MRCGVFCFSLRLYSALGFTVSISLSVFSGHVIASLPSLIQGGFFMGALREKMIEEMRLRNFASRTQKSYLAVMVGLAKHYRQFPDQLTQEQIRTYRCTCKTEAYRAVRRTWPFLGYDFSINKFWGGTKGSCFCRRASEAGVCRKC